jgi:hypothetical protein
MKKIFLKNGEVVGLSIASSGFANAPEGCEEIIVSVFQEVNVGDIIVYDGDRFSFQPNSASLLLKAKQTMWEKIKKERDRREDETGFKVDNEWFHSDRPSHAKYSTLLTLALEMNLPNEYVLEPAWKDMHGNFAPMTVGKLRQIRNAGVVIVSQIFARAEVHRFLMEQSEDPLIYDYSTGWPEAFEDL